MERHVADHVAARNGFFNLGPVSFSTFIRKNNRFYHNDIVRETKKPCCLYFNTRYASYLFPMNP